MDVDPILDQGIWSALERWLRPSRVKSDTVIPASARLEKLNDQVFEVCKPPGSGRPSLEMVFFHGLQLERSSQPHVTTWLSRDKSELWLNWLRDDIPDIRVLIVSYDASREKTEKEGRTDIYITCENLLHDLTGSAAHVGQDECPVILVGHCLGGLVMKEVCVKANSMLSLKDPDYDRQAENLRKFLENLKGVFFYATPHHGAIILPGLSASSSSSSREGRLLRDLAPLNEQAQRRNEEFRMLRELRKWKAAGVGEGREVSTGSFTGFVVSVSVPEASSRSGMDAMGYYTATAADHFNVCRPTDKNCASFTQRRNFIEQVLEEYQHSVAPPLSLPNDILGMDGVIKDVKEKLKSTKRLAIIGMAGVGKTTLVEYLYDHIKGGFQYASFVYDVKGKMGYQQDISRLQNLIKERLTVRGMHEVGAGFNWSRLKNKKILIILDDVENRYHVKMMRGKDEFSEESRFIVTSRNKMILGSEGFKFHEMGLLSDHDSYKLLCLRAFGKEEAPDDFQGHVEEVLLNCKNVPLALKVVGSALFDRELIHWNEMTETIAGAYSVDGSYPSELWSLLRRSFDSLDKREQEMFLDIATCFHEMYIPHAKRAWKFMIMRSAESGWQNLIDRGLAKQDHLGCIFMHELLRDLGKSIARIGQAGNSPIHTRVEDVQIASELFPEERSRVQVLKLYDKNRRDDCEPFDMRELHCFHDLRALWLEERGRCDNLPELLTNGCIFPAQLTYVDIRLAGSVAMNGICRIRRLRCLILRGGVEELPPSLGHLVHLEYLKMGFCGIKVIPVEIGKLRSLQHLEVTDCHELTLIPTEIGQLRKLRHFDIRDCNSLKSLPNSITQLEALQAFMISKCDSLVVSFSLLCKLRALKNMSKFEVDCLVDGCYDLRVTDDDRQCVFLVTSAEATQLDQKEWLSTKSTSAVGIHVHLWDAGEETRFYVGGFENVPGDFSDRQQLRMERVLICNILGEIDRISTLSTDNFRDLQTLEIVDCHQVTTLPPFGPQLSALRHLYGGHLPSLRSLPELRQLQTLKVLQLVDLPRLERLPESIGHLRVLESLRLQSLHILSELPGSVGHLQALIVMELIDLPRFDSLPQSLGELAALRDLTINQCACLKSSRGTACNWGLRSLETLTLDSDYLDDVDCDDGRQSLDALTLDTYRPSDHCCEWFWDCFGLHKNSSAVDSPENSSTFPKNEWEYRMGAVEILEAAVLGKFPRLKCVALTMKMQDVELFADLGRRLYHLERLKIRGSPGFMKLPESCGRLGSLKVLKIVGCDALVELPESVGQLSAMEKLKIIGCPALQTLPAACGVLRSLKLAKFERCDALVELPDSLGQLPALEQLEITRCSALLTLHGSCGEFGSLKVLKIERCDALLELPEWVGQLRALEHLEIVGCKKLTKLKGSVGQVRTLERLIISSVHREPLAHERLAGILHSIVIVERGSLKRLTIKDFDSNDEELAAALGQLHLLEHLDLVECGRIQSLPQSVGQICGLKCLTIERCQMLEELPEFIGQLGPLQRVAIKRCSRLANLGNFLGQLGALETMEIQREIFEKLAGYLGQFSLLKRLTVECFWDDGGELPDSLGQLGALEELVIRDERKGLTYHLGVYLSRPNQKWAIRKLPESIGQLSGLKRLEIIGSEELAQLPLNVGGLQRLGKIVVRHCPKLEAWRPSSQHLQHVQELELTYEDPERRFRDEVVTTILQRQDLLTMAEEGRSLLEAAMGVRYRSITEEARLA